MQYYKIELYVVQHHTIIFNTFCGYKYVTNVQITTKIMITNTAYLDLNIIHVPTHIILVIL